MGNANAGTTGSRDSHSSLYRVYWEDTDAGGVVYHARYLHFFERARSDWLRALGYAQSMVRDRLGRLFAVSRMNIDFRTPARIDDELEVRVAIQALGSASVTFAQTMLRDDGVTLATAKVRVACLDAADFRPARIPEELIKKLREHK